MPDCTGGCLCDDCCRAARAFAYGHWNLQQYDDFEAGISHAKAWLEIGEGCSSRRIHLPEAA